MATIVTRAGKGSPLTQAEVDQNFINLNTDKLDTSGLALGSAASPSLKFTGDTNTGLYSPGADQVALATAGTGRLFVAANGNVGIGAAPGACRLDVQGGGQTILNQGGVSFLEIGAGTSTSQIALIDFTTDTTYTDYGLRLIRDSGGANGVSQLVQRGTGELSLRTTEGAPLTFYTTNTERARIDSSGRLLMGTTGRSNFFNAGNTAGFQFEGQGGFGAFTRTDNDTFGAGLVFAKTRSSGNTIVQNNDTVGLLTFQGSDGSEFVECANIQAFVDGTPGANDMPGRIVLSTTAAGAVTPTERMRIGSNGTVLVSHASAADVLIVESTNASFVNSCLLLKTTRGAGTNGLYVYCTANSVPTFLVFNNGNVQNTNNSYGAISDIKLKENIVDANSQWDDLKALQVRKYNFKEGQTHTQIGLVAQEVELVSPGLVSESPDRDEEGNDLGTVTKSVNYSVLYMKAVKALQEAMERIEALEARLAAADIE